YPLDAAKMAQETQKRRFQATNSGRKCSALRLRLVLPRAGIVWLAGHERSQHSGKLRKFIEDAHGAQPLFVIEGGGAAHHRAGRNIAVCATLRRHDDAVADVAVSGDADLTGE